MTEPTLQSLIDQRADLQKRLAAIQGRINAEDYQDALELSAMKAKVAMMDQWIEDLDVKITEKTIE